MDKKIACHSFGIHGEKRGFEASYYSWHKRNAGQRKTNKTKKNRAYFGESCTLWLG